MVRKCGCLRAGIFFTAWFFYVLLIASYSPWQVDAQGGQGSVDIRVVDFDTEEPIFRADVRLYRFGAGNESYRAFTAGPGNVSFPAVNGGSYYLEVTADNYETSRESAEVHAAVNNSFTARLHRKPGAAPESSPGTTVSAASLSIPAGARKEFEEGQSWLRKNDTPKALKHFQRAIQLYPGFAQAYAMLGLVYLQQKQTQDAEAALAKAIALDSHLALPRTLLGKLEFERRNFGRAEELLLESSRLDPGAWETKFELGRVYYNLGKLDKALEFARGAQSNSRASTLTHLLLVDIYLRKGDKSGALQELEEFARADPKSSLTPRVQQKIAELRRVN